MSNQRRGGLGKGLGALIPSAGKSDDTTDTTPGEAGTGGDRAGARLRQVPINAVQANPRQPREDFDDEELDGLAASILQVGLLQPIVVRPLEEDGRWELVAGERRLRAARRAGLDEIDAVVRDTEDGDLLKEALIENIHRVQLNPLEEAAAYGQLLDDFDTTQEELARRLGKGRTTISNALRLLTLPPPVQRRVAAGVLSAGHAKALVGLPSATAQEHVADKIVAEGLSVRATEELVRLRYLEGDDDEQRRSRTSPRELPASMQQLQADLADALGHRVRIRMGARKGTLSIDFRRAEDLSQLVEVIARGLSATGAGTDRDDAGHDDDGHHDDPEHDDEREVTAPGGPSEVDVSSQVTNPFD